MKKNIEELLEKTTKNRKEEENLSNVLADRLNQFDKADQIMSSLNNEKLDEIQKNLTKVDKMEYVTYSIPESLSKIINDIIRKCMREELLVNKSEIVRLGIQMVNELSFQQLKDRLENVRVERGRPKNN